MRNALDKLDDDKVVALSQYINEKGRYWRKHFAEDQELPPELYLIHMRYGAAIVHSLDTNAIHAEAQLVLQARKQ